MIHQIARVRRADTFLDGLDKPLFVVQVAAYGIGGELGGLAVDARGLAFQALLQIFIKHDRRHVPLLTFAPGPGVQKSNFHYTPAGMGVQTPPHPPTGVHTGYRPGRRVGRGIEAMNEYALNLDPRIAPLVRAMNATGVFTTIASCQGHRWRRMAPYVYFRAPTPVAAMLNRLIDEDILRETGALNYGWRIVAQFNLSYELCFGLISPALTYGPWPWWSRSGMVTDFGVLEKLVQRAATDHWKDHLPEKEAAMTHPAAILLFRHRPGGRVGYKGSSP